MIEKVQVRLILTDVVVEDRIEIEKFRYLNRILSKVEIFSQEIVRSMEVAMILSWWISFSSW